MESKEQMNPASGCSSRKVSRSDGEVVISRTSTPPRASCSRLGPRLTCSSTGGLRSRPASSSSPARSIYASAAATVSNSAPRDRWSDDDVLRPVPRGSAAVAAGLEQRGKRRRGPVTTVTFEEKGGQTLLSLREVYPSREALDQVIASGSTGAYPEQFEELDRLLAGRGGRAHVGVSDRGSTSGTTG